MLRQTLSSLSKCLLLDVKRFSEGPATTLEKIEHLTIAGLRLELTAAITCHGQHFMAHVRRGPVIITYDDARVSQAPAWPPHVFSNCTVFLLRRLSTILDSPPNTGSRMRALAEDARRLLSLFASQKPVECVQFLQNLPVFFEHPGDELKHLPRQLRDAINILQSEAIHCASALECRFAFHDTMLYPLAVLFEATALATGMPAVFCGCLLCGRLPRACQFSLSPVTVRESRQVPRVPKPYWLRGQQAMLTRGNLSSPFVCWAAQRPLSVPTKRYNGGCH